MNQHFRKGSLMPHSVIQVENPAQGQSFTALAEEGEIELDPGSRESGPMLIFGGHQWVYMSGTKPSVDTGDARGQAAGTKMVAHRIPASGGNAARTRFIVLESQKSATITLSDGSASQEVTAEHYVDVWQSTPPTIGPPALFDEDDPESSAIMSAVAAARTAEGVS